MVVAPSSGVGLSTWTAEQRYYSRKCVYIRVLCKRVVCAFELIQLYIVSVIDDCVCCGVCVCVVVCVCVH